MALAGGPPSTAFGAWSLGILPLVGDRTPRLFRQSSWLIQASSQVSPDGRWIAYQSNESGHFEVYVRNLPAPASPTPSPWPFSDPRLDVEASHPKIGFLVREAAERSQSLLRPKRSNGSDR